MSDFEDRYRGKHMKFSFIKSAIRIGACIGAFVTAVWGGDVVMAIGELTVGFLIAELVGIGEEMI